MGLKVFVFNVNNAFTTNVTLQKKKKKKKHTQSEAVSLDLSHIPGKHSYKLTLSRSLFPKHFEVFRDYISPKMLVEVIV